MKILFLNHDGGGFADHIEIEEGTTVETLFASRMKDARPEDYLIRVNRQPCSAGQQLQDEVGCGPLYAAILRVFLLLFSRESSGVMG